MIEKCREGQKQTTDKTIVKADRKSREVTERKPEKVNKPNEQLNERAFQDFLTDSAMSSKARDFTRKRASENFNTDDNQKRHKTESKNNRTSFIPTELTELPKLEIGIDDESFGQANIMNRSDLSNLYKINSVPINDDEDIDVTSKYVTERKMYTPKLKDANGNVINVSSVPSECELINGVPVTELATYSAKQLREFEANNRKIIRKTNCFWEKLFMRNFKLSSKFDDEKWRDAHFRAEAEEEAKLKQLSERLNKKSEMNKKNESRALMINEPFKQVRRTGGGSYRR